METLRTILAVAAVAITGLLAWILFVYDEKESGAADRRPEARNAAATSVAALSALADTVSNPVHWAGRRHGAQLELTETEDGQIYLRYLTGDAEAGDPRPEFLTVGTYPVPNALAALRRAARRANTSIQEGSGRTFLFVDRRSPNSVYLARRNSNFQVEVFDPNPAAARRLALSGAIRPVP